MEPPLDTAFKEGSTEPLGVHNLTISFPNVQNRETVYTVSRALEHSLHGSIYLNP